MADSSDSESSCSSSGSTSYSDDSDSQNPQNVEIALGIEPWRFEPTGRVEEALDEEVLPLENPSRLQIFDW